MYSSTARTLELQTTVTYFKYEIKFNDTFADNSTRNRNASFAGQDKCVNSICLDTFSFKYRHQLQILKRHYCWCFCRKHLPLNVDNKTTTTAATNRNQPKQTNIKAKILYKKPKGQLVTWGVDVCTAVC